MKRPPLRGVGTQIDPALERYFLIKKVICLSMSGVVSIYICAGMCNECIYIPLDKLNNY
jgi:hypothetical protein